MDIIIFNGFLGSGKTSAITHILENNPCYKFALLINEFGSHDIDGKQLENLSQHTVSINNGSIFCSCRSDKFVSTMLELVLLDIDVILVESSGFANPASLLRLLAFIVVKSANKNIFVKNILTVVCPLQFKKLVYNSTSYMNQVMISDCIILNKSDLVSQRELECVSGQLSDLNTNALIYKTKYGEIDFISLPPRCDISNNMSRLPDNKDLSQKRITLELNSVMRKKDLIKLIKASTEYCLRIKGFVCCVEGDFNVQMASGNIELTPTAQADNKLVILYSSTSSSKEKLMTIFIDSKVVGMN